MKYILLFSFFSLFDSFKEPVKLLLFVLLKLLFFLLLLFLNILKCVKLFTPVELVFMFSKSLKKYLIKSFLPKLVGLGGAKLYFDIILSFNNLFLLLFLFPKFGF